MALLTLLAEGRRFALCGTAAGVFVAVPIADLRSLGELGAPELVRCAPLDSPRVGKWRMVVRRDLPPEVILYFQYYTCPTSGITVYYVYYADARRWYLRELRDEQGNGSGNYYREG